jgi:hypothetical protein
LPLAQGNFFSALGYTPQPLAEEDLFGSLGYTPADTTEIQESTYVQCVAQELQSAPYGLQQMASYAQPSRLQVVSWNIYCSLLKILPRSIRRLGLNSLGSQVIKNKKIIAMKHRPHGDYFPGTQVDKCYSLHSEKPDV